MRKRVILKFTSDEAQQLLDFSNMVGMDLEQVCKRAVMYAMNDTIRRAEQMEREQKQKELENGIHDTAPADASGAPEGEGRPSPDSNPLADSEAPSNP